MYQQHEQEIHRNKDCFHIKPTLFVPSTAQEEVHTHLSLFEPGLQITEVHVFVAQPLGSTQADAVDDGCVVQLVGQHRVVWTQQNLVQRQCGELLIITGGQDPLCSCTSLDVCKA